MKNSIRIGTRGSGLALAQSTWVKECLEKLFPKLRFELSIIKTSGDRLQKDPGYEVDPIFGVIPKFAPEEPASSKKLSKGLFTKEIERALLQGKIEMAVHSLKDMPTEETGGLVIGAVPKREDARDVLVSRSSERWEQIPSGAMLATGSPRRRRELLWARGDLQFSEIRGNIDTRLRKLEAHTEWQGIVLAKAGLERLRPPMGKLQMSVIPFSAVLPAPGQGALGLQCRRDDEVTLELLRRMDHHASRLCVEVERAFLAGLGGGCLMALGALAVHEDGKIRFEARLHPEGVGCQTFSCKWHPQEAVHQALLLGRKHLESLPPPAEKPVKKVTRRAKPAAG